MINIEFPTWDKDSQRILDHFKEQMIISKPTERKDIIILGALLFYPDGHMVSTIQANNMVLNLILNNLQADDIDYDLIGS